MQSTSSCLVYLLSDSTGETVHSVARAVLSQFENVNFQIKPHSLIRGKDQLLKALDAIALEPGPILYTFIDQEFCEVVQRFGVNQRIPNISVLADAVAQISSYYRIQSELKPGNQHVMDDDYFRRVEAMNYVLQHDDGQKCNSIAQADIVLVGPSRTSKSPTSIYLAHRGYKVANVPFVLGCQLPESLFYLDQILVVGLSINPNRLTGIRQNRMQALEEGLTGEYANESSVKKEMLAAKRLYSTQQWPVLDVTHSSVEETAAKIIALYNEFKKNGLSHGRN